MRQTRLEMSTPEPMVTSTSQREVHADVHVVAGPKEVRAQDPPAPADREVLTHGELAAAGHLKP